MKTVPKKPTRDQIEAVAHLVEPLFTTERRARAFTKEIYEAMIEAAPAKIHVQKLTKGMKEIMIFIQEHFDEHGKCPTMREVALATGKGLATVHYSIGGLIKRKYLRRPGGKRTEYLKIVKRIGE